MKEYLYFAAQQRQPRLQYRGCVLTPNGRCAATLLQKDPGRLLYYDIGDAVAVYFLENKWYLEITPTYHYTRMAFFPTSSLRNT